MAIGSVLLGITAIAGGVGAAVGAGWASKKYLFGEKRELTELEKQERVLVEAALALAIGFRQKEASGESIDTYSAKIIYGDALKPLCEKLAETKLKTKSWPYIARLKLEIAVNNLTKLSKFLFHWSAQNPNVATGIVSAVIIQLLSEDLDSFNRNEELVLDALRRSKTSLSDASNEELSEYVKSLEPSQIQGLTNNVKGIYHELRFADKMNNDNDSYIVELFESTNHAGADVRIINTLTDEVKEVQLKATSYTSLVRQHNEKYSDIDIMATEGVARKFNDVESTGFTNNELTEETKAVLVTLDNHTDSHVISSMSVAAIITLSKNIGLLLKGDDIPKNDRDRMLKDSVLSASVAGFVSLLVF